jgi:hypothetical protein
MLTWKVVKENPRFHETQYEGCLSTNKTVKVSATVETSDRYLYLSLHVMDIGDSFSWDKDHVEFHLATSFLKTNRDAFLTAGAQLLLERVQEKIAAEARAMKLLNTMLLPAQRRSLKKYGYFHEQGKATRRWYRLYKDETSIEPCEIKSGQIIPVYESNYYRPYYCLHPEDEMLPWPDRLVSQLLTLRVNEMKFRRAALYHGVRYRTTHRLVA